MCLDCTCKLLEQLRWELVVQETQLQGNKVSSEVMESAKTCADENGGLLLPKVKLTRPKDMNDRDFSEAKNIFKDVMLSRRQDQIAAIGMLLDLIDNEIAPQPGTIKISAAEVFPTGDEGI